MTTLMWAGQPVEEMDREQLLRTVYDMQRVLEQERKWAWKLQRMTGSLSLYIQSLAWEQQSRHGHARTY